MAKKQYRYSGSSKWMGLSGNAILGLYCVPGSGKKISVHSVEITNKLVQGPNASADGSSPGPVRFKVIRGSHVGGTPLTPSKLNSAAADWPSTVKVSRNAAYTPTYVNWNGSVTYTDATVVVGDVAFTPGSAPSWIANEHREGGRYFIGTSGNVGVYRIISNTTTDLTVEPPFAAAVSTTGYVAQLDSLLHHGVTKTCQPATTAVFVSSCGYINQNVWGSTGSVFHKGMSSDQQDIYVRAAETLNVVVDQYINTTLPMFVEATFVVEGSPNRTYQLSYYTFLDSQTEAVLSIDNTAGSGKVVRLVQLSVTEVGNLDTPYFQVVPIGSIDPASFSDASTQLTATPTNSAHGDLSGSIAILFTNVPVIPAGVPISYIAEGAPVAAVPRGFNYLNSKDFIGPVYMTFFPEAASYKVPNTTFWSSSVPGTIGSHVSQEFTKVKGYGGAPIVLREGEALGIVSGAETATGTTAVGISGLGAYEFSLVFTVEETFTPTVSLNVQLVSGAPLENAQVLLTTNTGATLPFQATITIANSSTTATVTHSSHGLVTGDKVLIKGASHYQNNGVFTVSVVNTNTYTYTMASSPGSSPTGTIKATFVFLSGVTNALGKISTTRDLPSVQPVVGWARKSSGAPFYKTAPISGSVSNTSDTTLSALMIPDE